MFKLVCCAADRVKLGKFPGVAILEDTKQRPDNAALIAGIKSGFMCDFITKPSAPVAKQAFTNSSVSWIVRNHDRGSGSHFSKSIGRFNSVQPGHRYIGHDDIRG